MILRVRSFALKVLVVMLFLGVVNGQDIQGMAIIANNEKALGITVGPVTVAPGHVAFAYQNPLTALFVFGSVGMDLTKPTNLIDPKDLDINKEYTFDELKILLANKGYTSYKAFYVNSPNFDAATKAEIDLTTANYNLFASTTKPITDPFSHAVGADDENCLTGTKKVLEAYGVDLPDWDESVSDTISVASLPNVWYLSLPGKTYYPDFMGDDPIVPTGYKKSPPLQIIKLSTPPNVKEEAMSWSKKGNSLVKQDKYDEAIKCYDKAIELDSAFAWPWNNKGYVFYLQGKYDQAIQACDKAIELDPQFSAPWGNKAMALNRLSKYDEALKAADKALEIGPEDGETWFCKGEALMALGQQADADAAFAKAKELGYTG